MKNPFIPPPLPPDLSGIYTPDFVRRLGEANRALAKLGELPNLLPNTDLLAAPLLRKEAVSSSAIEGTQTTLAELYKYEAKIEDKAIRKEDAREVEGYVKALHQGMEDVKNLSLSLRTVKNMHKVLLESARKDQGVPGEFRNFQAYIAPPGTPIEQATFIPVPPLEVAPLMDALEQYMNNKKALDDIIVRCGLIHYQFEAIHPFGDGNGRIGRLLIPLFFYEMGAIEYPLVYVSEFFEKDRRIYYDRLLNISERNDWQGWLSYFLEAVRTQAEATARRGKAIIELYKNYHEIIRQDMQSSNAVALVEHIFRHPYTAAPFVKKKMNVSPVTAMRLLEQFARRGLLKRSKGVMKRQKFSRPVRLYVFEKLISIVNMP